MGEWWTYGLSDFLMFSPRTYWRLVELHQRAMWPGQVLAFCAGVGCLVLARASGRRKRAIALLVLAVTWLWVGWAFHARRYATINWAATYFAAAFAAQALLLAALAWRVALGPAPRPGQGPGRYARPGWLLAAVAVVLYPLAGWLAGRPLVQSDAFGVTPDPTALATLALLPSLAAGLPRRWLWPAMILPVLSLAIGAATLRAMAN